MYLTGSSAVPVNCIFRQVGKPAPPRPLRPEAFTVSMISEGSMASAFRRPSNPPRAAYSAALFGSIFPRFLRRFRTSLISFLCITSAMIHTSSLMYCLMMSRALSGVRFE